MDKLWVTCPTEQSAIKGNKLEIHATSWKKKISKNIMLRKTDLKGYILHDFIYVCDFLERQNYLIRGCQAKGPQGNFWGDGYILYLFFSSILYLEWGTIIYCLYLSKLYAYEVLLYVNYTLISLTLKKEKYITINWYTKLCCLNFKII